MLAVLLIGHFYIRSRLSTLTVLRLPSDKISYTYDGYVILTWFSALIAELTLRRRVWSLMRLGGTLVRASGEQRSRTAIGARPGLNGSPHLWRRVSVGQLNSPSARNPAYYLNW